MKTAAEKETLLASYNYVVKLRDPSVNPEHSGCWMLIDDIDPDGYKIVGDDRDELIHEADRHMQLGPCACQQCHGRRGGVKGNEVMAFGKILCDYCYADSIHTFKESE